MPGVIQHYDLSVLSAVHLATSQALDWISSVVSTLTWAGWCWWVLAAVLWMRGHRRFAVQLAVALLLAAFGSELAKHLLHRIRPSMLYPQFVHLVIPDIMPSKYSFPSGHSALAAAAAFVILALTNFSIWGWLAVFAAVIVGWSRIYAGVHWPSDVVGGFVFGALAAWLSSYIMIPLRTSKILMQKNGSSSSRVPHGTSLESKL